MSDIASFIQNSACATPPIPLLAPPSRKLLCALGDCVGPEASDRPLHARTQLAWGYKTFIFSFGHDGEHVGAILAATNDDTVELQTLIAYPDRRGHGTEVMRKICRLADSLGVSVWLDAHPFGSHRQHITVEKLKGFYGRFGFIALKRVSPDWVNGYHRWDRYKFTNPMLRRPVLPMAAAGRGGATGMDVGSALCSQEIAA